MPFDHFGFLAPFYDRLIRFGEADSLIRHLGLPIEGRLLDAGGGTGRVAEALHEMSGQVIIADISLGMLRQAKLKGLQGVVSPLEALPFHDGVFERVLMVDALHHVMDQTGTALELLRVLMPGGRMVIVEPDIRQLPVKWIALFEKLMLMRSHFLSPTKIAHLFEDLGAQVKIEVESVTAWVVINKVRNS
jgi:ubiquinone/menaquinone biosynthesis C-methylase UbiE